MMESVSDDDSSDDGSSSGSHLHPRREEAESKIASVASDLHLPPQLTPHLTPQLSQETGGDGTPNGPWAPSSSGRSRVRSVEEEAGAASPPHAAPQSSATSHTLHPGDHDLPAALPNGILELMSGGKRAHPSSLRSLSEDRLPASLKVLDLRHCPLLDYLPALPASLQRLVLHECPELMELPDALPPSLTTLQITQCSMLDRLPPNMPNGLTVLVLVGLYGKNGGTGVESGIRR